MSKLFLRGVSYTVHFHAALGGFPAFFRIQFVWTYRARYGYVNVDLPAVQPVRGRQNPIRRSIAAEIWKLRKRLPQLAQFEADFNAANRRRMLRLIG